jgi:hypothetical protein
MILPNIVDRLEMPAFGRVLAGQAGLPLPSVKKNDGLLAIAANAAQGLFFAIVPTPDTVSPAGQLPPPVVNVPVYV